MADIAQATNVGPSALYRHFPSKAHLLVAAIQNGLKPFTMALSEAEEAQFDPSSRLAMALRGLASAAIGHRTLGVLWQRDARNLTDDDQRELRLELRSLADGLARLIRAARPGLAAAHADALAWCAMGVIVSLSFHSLELPRPEFDDVMVAIVSRVCAAMVVTADSADPRRRTQAPGTRRDALITVATALIADRGFVATGIDAIGDAAGIAGPSVYTHFVSKQAILAAAIQRANGRLEEDLTAVLSSGAPAEEQLAQLIESYVRLANEDRAIIRTLIADMDQLPTDDREDARRDQRRYIDAWVALLRDIHDIDSVPARLEVQAVLLAVNDAVQTPHLRAQPGFEQILVLVAKQVLGLDISS